MKYSFIYFIFLSIAISQIASAARFKSSIYSIESKVINDSYLIRFDNGRVSLLNHQDKNLLNSLLRSKENNEIIEVQTDNRNVLYSAQTIGKSKIRKSMNSFEATHDRAPYRPSILINYEIAKRVFARLKGNYLKDGECYNRAHIWAYEEFKRKNLRSMKIFMFFTEKYIREHNFPWWFHVTPMFYVGSIKAPRTMDRRYTSGPKYIKTWSDVFIKNKTFCRTVKKFNDYWLNQKVRDCYHIHTSMYYYTPEDIKVRDATGMEKTSFDEYEIDYAYWDAFQSIGAYVY